MDTLRLLASLAWRNLWRNRRRSLLLMLAVGMGVWSLIGTSALMQAWSDSMLDAGLLNLTGQGQVHARGYLDDPNVEHGMAPPTPRLRQLLDGPDVTAWSERIRVPATIQSEYETYPVTLLGIQPARERGLSFIGAAVDQGATLADADANGILLGRELARRLHTLIGRRVVVMSQSASGDLAERGFRVVGIYASSEENEKAYVFTGLHTAQHMLGTGTRISEISFDLHQRDLLDAFVARLRTAAPGLDVKPWQDLLPMVKATNDLSGAFIWVWLAIMFVLLALGIVNTLLMALFERIRELGLLQALGMSPRLIFAQVMLETSMLVGFGVLAGMALGAGTVLLFHDGLDLGFLAAGAEWFGGSRMLYPRISPRQFTEIGLLIWTLGVAASAWPAWRNVRHVPVEAMRRAT
jgi:ABC-type lipoprotein release transport system permease subunit